MRNNPHNSQKGSFAIELAFVLVGLCMIFMFSTDLSHKLLVRAKLDRSSFALVNVLKERTRYFYDENLDEQNYHVTGKDRNNMEIVAARMLNTTQENVAIRIESLVDGTRKQRKSDRFKQLNCGSDSILDYSELAPEEDGLVHPLYRVTLCEESQSWFQSFTNGGDPMMTITSSSIMPGR